MKVSALTSPLMSKSSSAVTTPPCFARGQYPNHVFIRQVTVNLLNSMHDKTKNYPKLVRFGRSLSDIHEDLPRSVFSPADS